MFILFLISVALLVFPFFCKWFLIKYLSAWSDLVDILKNAGEQK